MPLHQRRAIAPPVWTSMDTVLLPTAVPNQSSGKVASHCSLHISGYWAGQFVCNLILKSLLRGPALKYLSQGDQRRGHRQEEGGARSRTTGKACWLWLKDKPLWNTCTVMWKANLAEYPASTHTLSRRLSSRVARAGGYPDVSALNHHAAGHPAGPTAWHNGGRYFGSWNPAPLHTQRAILGINCLCSSGIQYSTV